VGAGPARGHLFGIAVPGDVHVERCGSGPKNVVVNGRDVQSAVQQLAHDRGNFGIKQHEVAHHHGLAVHGRESHPSSQRQGWLDGDAVQRDAQVGSRQSIAVNFATHGGGFAQGRVNLLPVDVSGMGR